MNTRIFAVVLSAVAAGGCASTTAVRGTPGTAATSMAPLPLGSARIVETATGRTVPMAALVERAADADVVFFGEQHDDPETHFLEFALVEALGRRVGRVVLSLEMFERDAQPALNRYLAGAVSESTFLASARPWPRYATDYRPMVQLARARGWTVLAANIPRPMASAVSRKGMAALDTLTAAERAYAAATMICAADGPYFRRFEEAMGGHTAGGGPPTASDADAQRTMTARFYEAQCAKDETMAESIARQLETDRGMGVTVHVNGAFHSDYGQGTVERLRRRMPAARILVITAVPVADPAAAVLEGERAKADYVIFTRKP